MDKISVWLWFDDEAEEAARFYTSIFRNSRMGEITRTPADTPGPQTGDVITVEFELEGRSFAGLNGGKPGSYNESVSLQVACENQAEVDHFWEKLTADGGKEIACGWLQDKYGVRWQITPVAMTRLLKDPDRARARRAMQAMMDMVKLDIAALERAAAGG